MTAAARTSCYFVLVVNGQPLAQDGSPHLPAIFRSEQAALTLGQRLRAEGQAHTVILESYADDYTFIGGQAVEAAGTLTVQSF